MALIEGHIEDNGDVDGEEDDSVGGQVVLQHHHLQTRFTHSCRTVLPVTQNQISETPNLKENICKRKDNQCICTFSVVIT